MDYTAQAPDDKRNPNFRGTTRPHHLLILNKCYTSSSSEWQGTVFLPASIETKKSSWLNEVFEREREKKKGNSTQCTQEPGKWNEKHVRPNLLLHWLSHWGVRGMDSGKNDRHWTKVSTQLGNKSSCKYAAHGGNKLGLRCKAHVSCHVHEKERKVKWNGYSRRFSKQLCHILSPNECENVSIKKKKLKISIGILNQMS